MRRGEANLSHKRAELPDVASRHWHHVAVVAHGELLAVGVCLGHGHRRCPGGPLPSADTIQFVNSALYRVRFYSVR